MKKWGFVIVAALIMIVLLILSNGCQEAARGPQLLPMRRQLLPTHPKWELVYGDGDESNLHSNIWCLLQTTRMLDKKVKALEKPVEPNEPK